MGRRGGDGNGDGNGDGEVEVCICVSSGHCKFVVGVAVRNVRNLG